eukprot:c31252_g1_i1 orf=95-376(+)
MWNGGEPTEAGNRGSNQWLASQLVGTGRTTCAAQAGWYSNGGLQNADHHFPACTGLKGLYRLDHCLLEPDALSVSRISCSYVPRCVEWGILSF